MAYVPSKLVCVTPRLGSGPALWIYNSTDEAHGTIVAAVSPFYFTNGKKLGMKVGDQLIIAKSGSGEGSTLHSIKAVADAGVTLTAAILA